MVFNWFKRLFYVFLGFGVTTLITRKQLEDLLQAWKLLEKLRATKKLLKLFLRTSKSF